MQQHIDSKRLGQRLTAAIRRRALTYEQAAETSGIDPSRVSRFCSGEFKRVTPVLIKLCLKLEVSWEDCIAENDAKTLHEDIYESVRLLVNKNPKKAKVVRRLIRSVRLLVDIR